jgi:hypothetical protein
MAQFDLKFATVIFKDGGSNSLSIKVGDGTITYDEKRVMHYTLDRGKVASGDVKEGNEEPMEVSFDLMWEFLRVASGNVVPTPEEVLKQIGAASAWVTSGADACEPYCIDILIKYAPGCGTLNEFITLSEFRWENLNHEAKQGMISCKGKCKRTQATVVRTATT